MKNQFLLSILLLVALLGGCGVSENRSTLNSADASAPVLENVEIVHYAYPLDNSTLSRFRTVGKSIARFVPYSGKAAKWLANKTNTNLNHADIMVISHFSDGNKAYQSAAWGKKFPERGEVSYFKEIENSNHFALKESITLTPEEYAATSQTLPSVQSKYDRDDYRFQGDWLSSGWNCQTMADDVWELFAYRAALKANQSS